MESNFSFIKEKFTKIYKPIKTAEMVLEWGDSSTVISNCGKAIELGVKFFAEIEGVETYRKDQYEIIRDENLDISKDLYYYLDGMRKMRNRALHTDQSFSLEEGITGLKMTHIIFRYIYENYIPFDEQIEVEEFDESFYSFSEETEVQKNKVEDPSNIDIAIDEAIEEIKTVSNDKKHGNVREFRTDIISEKEKSNLVIWSEDVDVSEALKKDNDEWRIFLHPRQRKVAQKSYSGPVLIEGGPGTGKSIVGIYRALELSKTIYPASAGKKILFLTFLKNLVNTLENDIERIYDSEGIEKNVKVKGIDSFLLEVMRSITPKFKMSYTLDWDIKNINSRSVVGNRFLRYEYEEIILKRDIRTFDEYKGINESLDRTPLKEDLFSTVWDLLLKIKGIRKSKMNSQEVCYFLLEKIKVGEVTPMYDSIIVDETQDLTSIQVEILKGLVKTTRNNLFFLSDPYQKIYNVDDFEKNLTFGFGKRKDILSINYRTTEQIKSYADKIFTDDNTLKDNYILENLLRGREVRQTETETSQVNNKLIEKAKNLFRKYKPEEIGILVPTTKEIKSLQSAAKKLKLDINEIKDTGYIQEDYVSVSTYAGSKGLEFKAVMVLDKDIYVEEGPYQKLEERKFQSQKYVACTRGREVLEVIKNVKKGEVAC